MVVVCLSFVVCCLVYGVFVDRRLSCVLCWLLLNVCSALFVVCYLWFDVWRLLFVAC